HEVGDLAEVPARMRKARRKAFGEHFGAPLHAPPAPVSIDHRDARLRSGRVFFEKEKRRDRHAAMAARTVHEVAFVSGTGMAPDAMTRRAQRPRPRAPNPIQPVQAPDRPQRSPVHASKYEV